MEKKRLWNKGLLKRSDIILTFILRFLFLIFFVISLIKKDYTLALVTTTSFSLTFIPSLLEKSIKVSLPPSFQIVLLFFIFNALFLGEIFNYYEKYWWWDLFLHSWSGILLGTVGFLLVYILNEAFEVSLVLSPFFIAFFALCFAVTCGVVWEVFEYIMDLLFGTNMQKSGLHDTMGDLIVDTLGGIIVSVNGYFALRKNIKNRLIITIETFMKKNPKMNQSLEKQMKRK